MPLIPFDSYFFGKDRNLNGHNLHSPLYRLAGMIVSFLIAFVIIFCATDVFAIPVDLRTFTPEPAEAVTIAFDGSYAILREDQNMAAVSLRNKNFFIPFDAVALNFDYELVVPTANEDYFDFYIIINSTARLVFDDGGSEGTYRGTCSYDLAALRGQTVYIIFDIACGWSDDQSYDSYVTVRNLNINPVPEPSTMMLIGTGSMLIAVMGMKLIR